MADNVVSQKRLMDDEKEKTGEGELMPLQKRATPITFEQQIIDLIKKEKVKDDKEKEEKVKDDKEKEEDAAIYNRLSIEIQEDYETQYDKESRCSQSLPQSLPESQPFPDSQSQQESQPQPAKHARRRHFIRGGIRFCTGYPIRTLFSFWG